jgi:hypothetical protein
MSNKLYNIVLELENSDPAIIKRSQEALELFARDLEPFSFPPEVNVWRSTLALNTSTNEAVSAENIQQFLLFCFTNVDIVHSKAVAHFLWDPSEDTKPDQSPISAIDFILQPLQNQQIYIPQHQQFFIDIRLDKGETLVWRYQVGCGQDVDFFALCCHSMFRSLKPHPSVAHLENSDDENPRLDEDSDVASDPPHFPSSVDQKLKEVLDEFIKARNHRLVERSHTSDLQSQSISIITASCVSSSSGSWSRSFPFLLSRTTTASCELSAPITGCYQAQTKGGLCRLLWDNSISSLSGKHLDYCVQKVSDETMQVEHRVIWAAV